MKLTYQAVRDVLRDCGPLKTHEILSFFPGQRQANVASIVNRMRKTAKRQVYIHSWTHESGGDRFYPCAVYALGDRPDAPKPQALSASERNRRVKDKRSLGRGVPNSVWALGAMS